MTEHAYVVSFYAYVQVETIIEPKWFQFWKKSQIVNTMEWKRYSLLLDQDEGDFLLDNSMCKSPCWRILYKALAGVGVDNIQNVQLEYATGHTNYHPSEYVSCGETLQ